jgi:ABC-2 type transport system permease protein
MNQKHFNSFKTLFVKEVRRFSHIWIQTIVPPAITTALYFLIFGQIVGGRIGVINGFTYGQYIAPGLIMMTLITNAYANVCTSFYMAKFSRSIEELLVAPMPSYILLLGYVGGGVMRGILVAIVVTLTALFFIKIQVVHVGLMLFAIIFSAALFSLAGLINAIFAKKFDDISIIPTFVLTPLTYLGGVFFPVSLLPGVWRDIAFANPILYFIDIFRYGMLGVADVNIPLAIFILLAFFTVLYLIALLLLNKGVGIKT